MIELTPLARPYAKALFASAIGAGVGVGVLGSKFIEGIARQPELAPFLQGRFFLMMGLTDAVPMIGVGLGMYMLFAA